MQSLGLGGRTRKFGQIRGYKKQFDYEIKMAWGLGLLVKT